MSGKSKRPPKPVDAPVREECVQCFRVARLCLCSSITHFEIEPLIVLLVHPHEFMRTVGTVRIVKNSIKNSIMWRGNGRDFDIDPKMQRLLADPTLHPVILFPGEDSLNLSTADAALLSEKIPPGKRLAIFVMDGTWSTAKQMIRQSKILITLPKISFNVDTLSIYEFRKQPAKFCLSTVEAVAVLVENLKEQGLCNPQPAGAHQLMLTAFKSLIASQVNYESTAPRSTRFGDPKSNSDLSSLG